MSMYSVHCLRCYMLFSWVVTGYSHLHLKVFNCEQSAGIRNKLCSGDVGLRVLKAVKCYTFFLLKTLKLLSKNYTIMN